MLLKDSETDVFAHLTPKQLEALDLLIQHKTSKEISRLLQISPHTVDQRIESAKRKLGVDSRGELAQAYRAYLNTCQQLTYGNSHIAEQADETARSISDEPERIEPMLDPKPNGLHEHDRTSTSYRVVHELFYGPMGTVYRVAVIVFVAVLFVVAALGGISIFVAMTEVLKK